MPRKNVSVESLIRSANLQLARTDSWSSPDLRKGIIAMVETILFEADQYAGFKYLNNLEMPEGVRPGVRFDEGGNILSSEQRFVDTDDTRRQYFLKKV